MAAKFLQQLLELQEDNLPSDSCVICFREYGTIQTAEEVTKAAVRLPCGHVMGSGCIATWLAPANGKNTCPCCRYKLFDINTFDMIDTRASHTPDSTSPSARAIRATRDAVTSEHLLSTAEPETSYAPPSPTWWPGMWDEQPSSPNHIPSVTRWPGMESGSLRRPARQ